MIRLSNRIRNLACDTITKVLAGGNMLILSGSRPRYPDDGFGNSFLMATLLFESKSGFTPAGISTLNPITGQPQGRQGVPGQADAILVSGTATAPILWLSGRIAHGTMAWFELLSSTGEIVADGLIGIHGQNRDLTVDSLVITSGGASSSSSGPTFGKLSLSLYRLSVSEQVGSRPGTFRLGNNIRNTVADAITKSLTGIGNTPGVVKIYSGSQPLHADDTPTGTLLLVLGFSSPAFQNAGIVDIGVAVANVINQIGSPTAKGIAGWFRMIDGNGDTLLDGSVGTKQSSTGDLLLDTTTVGDGVQIGINGLRLAIPQTISAA